MSVESPVRPGMRIYRGWFRFGTVCEVGFALPCGGDWFIPVQYKNQECAIVRVYKRIRYNGLEQSDYMELQCESREINIAVRGSKELPKMIRCDSTHCYFLIKEGEISMRVEMNYAKPRRGMQSYLSLT